jgi:dipeptidyl-peptidase 4
MSSTFTPSLTALAAGLALTVASSLPAQRPPEISIDAFYSSPSLIGTAPRGAAWSSDSRRVAFLWNDAGLNFLDVWMTDVETARPVRLTRLPAPTVSNDLGTDTLAQRAAIAAELNSGVGGVFWHPDGERVLFSFRGELWSVRPGSEPVRFTSIPGPMQRPSFSPDGRSFAWLSRGDLWWASLAGDSLGAAQRVTTLASAGIGVESFAWSPDGSAFALIETDRTKIPVRGIPDYLGEETVLRQVQRNYPGEPSESRRLGIVAARGGDVRWVDLGPEPMDLIFSYSWSPRGGQLVVDKSDLFVKDRRILLVDATTAATRLLVQERDSLNISAEWRSAWSADGQGVYFTSDRVGDYHLWYVPVNGRAPRAITSGEWAVFGSTLTRAGHVLVANAGRPEERQLFRVPLAGGAATRVSHRPGTHTPTVSPDGRWAAVVFSSDTVPPDLYLTDLTVARPSLASERRVTVSPRAEFARYTWVTPRYVTFPSRADGATLHARLQLPPSYQPGQRYPVIIGSAYSNTARNQWGGRNSHPLWGLDRVLLERGYVILAVDVAGSSGHGTDFRRRIRLDYGGIDVEDLHSGVEWLVAQGIADSSRVGIWGSSYGGLLTTMSLFTKPGVYAAGIAGAPATNVFHALTGEQRVMMRPQEQREAYINASSHTKAAGMRDRLLLIHGMRDVVVLYKDSVWLTQYLMQLGKDVELLTLPNAGHGWDLEANYQTRYAFEKMIEYFDRHLKGDR